MVIEVVIKTLLLPMNLTHQFGVALEKGFQIVIQQVDIGGQRSTICCDSLVVSHNLVISYKIDCSYFPKV